MFTDAILTTQNGRWVVEVEGIKTTLDPTSMPLDCIAGAIEDCYPDLWVHFDPEISENAWYRKHAEQERQGIFRPSLVLLEKEFSNTESRQCSSCRGKTYFNAQAKNWQCPTCYAVALLV